MSQPELLAGTTVLGYTPSSSSFRAPTRVLERTVTNLVHNCTIPLHHDTHSVLLSNIRKDRTSRRAFASICQKAIASDTNAGRARQLLSYLYEGV